MMRWYEDADGNFVEQFQTTGYDARIWELYLFAALSEAGYLIDRLFSAPRFSLRGARSASSAWRPTTVNPPLTLKDDRFLHRRPRPAAGSRVRSPLSSDPVRGAPSRPSWPSASGNFPRWRGSLWVFAIQDFHAPMTMTWSRAGLPTYLYGIPPSSATGERSQRANVSTFLLARARCRPEAVSCQANGLGPRSNPRQQENAS
jgi:hypothetical protein